VREFAWDQLITLMFTIVDLIHHARFRVVENNGMSFNMFGIILG